MSNPSESSPPVKVRLKTLRCRRTGRWLTPEQHRECPYCFGDEASFAKGHYRDFCDFKPGKDPISFGFPPDNLRL